MTAFSNDLKRKNAHVRRLVDVAVAEAQKLKPQDPIPDSAAPTLCVPFVEGLSAGNTKLANSALAILLRLVYRRAVPLEFVVLLVDTLHLWEVPALALETQLKVLQLLPPLVLQYTLAPEQFERLLALCSALAASGNVAVANTALATFQQIFSSLFDKLRGAEPETDTTAPKETETETRQFSVHRSGDEKPAVFSLPPREAQCFCTFLDLVCLALGEPPEHLHNVHISPQTLLEIIENVYAGNRAVFDRQPELVALVDAKLVPAVLDLLRRQPDFPVVVRTLRVAHLLLQSRVPALEDNGELLMAFSNHMVLDVSDTTLPQVAPGSGTAPVPAWESVLVLEMYAAIFADFATVQHLYLTYDANPRRKSLLAEVLAVLNAMLDAHYPQLFVLDTVPPLPLRSVVSALSKLSAAVKVSVLDHLDKQEPPAALPRLYSAHLVFKILLHYVNGVLRFVEQLSVDTSASLESHLDFITAMNDSLFPQVFHLLQKYLHCSMDADYFHSLVAALQDYVHAIGLLGLSSLRDGLLVMLSECIIKNSPVPDAGKKSGAAQLLSIGESIVESISSTIQNPASTPMAPLLSQRSEISSTKKITDSPNPNAGVRLFNSRQVECLGVMYSLAVSLGSTLQGSWKILWITFQWVDYYVAGPDQFNSIKDLKRFPDPKLKLLDMRFIADCKDGFLRSINDYQQLSFTELVLALSELYSATESAELTKIIPLEPCPFNKIFFVDLLVAVLQVNPTKFVLGDSDTWNHFIEYFTRLTIDRSVHSAVRNYLVVVFTDFIISLEDQRSETENLAQKSLNALNVFLSSLIALGTPQEHLVLNCETEMHLTALTTLHHLVDTYDENFGSSWETVFKILNTTFINTIDSSKQDHNVIEKMALLISTSYDTLKLILDEFLSTLSFSQLKSLIDTLLEFCSQSYDLNISFSSVSYFWLISDCIKSNIEANKEQVDSTIIDSVSDLGQLEELLSLPSTQNFGTMNQALHIYLLAKLSNLSSEARPRVREGAIQTLLQIIDAYGKQFPSWNLVYDIVLPDLFNLESFREIDSKKMQADAIESLTLVLTGLVSIYTKFMMNFEDEVDPALLEKFWARIAGYLQSMFGLNWKDLNLKIFQSYRDLATSLSAKDVVPLAISRLMFDFWVNVSVDYDFINPEYQDTLAVYNESFRPVYHFFKEAFTLEDASRVLSILNKCGRYPVLKNGQTDNTKPTLLQKAVLANLRLIDKPGENEEILSGVIQQLGTITAYPYEVRARIEAKLKSKFEGKLKIPTFIAVSEMALDLLAEKLNQLVHVDILLQDKNFIKIASYLLYAVRDKAVGIANVEKEPLWVRCNGIIAYLIARLVNESPEAIKTAEVLQQIVECILATFDNVAEADEEYNLRQYQALTKTFLPILFSLDLDHDALVEQFIFRVYKHSYLYALNDIERDLIGPLIDIPSATANLRAFELLANFDFGASFGSTAGVQKYPNEALRIRCVEELFQFTLSGNRCAIIALEYLCARCAFSIRRFVADERLLAKKPLPKIQQDEMVLLLYGVRTVQPMWSPVHQQHFQRLLSQTLPFTLRIDHLDALVQNVLEPAEVEAH